MAGNMRRSTLAMGLATSLALVLGQTLVAVAPAQAADTPVLWQPTPAVAPAGTGFWSDACATGAPDNIHTKLSDDVKSIAGTRVDVRGSAGSGSLDTAWQYSPGASNQAGPVLTVPAGTTSVTVQARSTTATPAKGRMLVYAPASGNGYYIGEAAISAGSTWTTIDQSAAVHWYQYKPPFLIFPESWSDLGTQPISAFATANTLVSYQFGCTSAPFQLDHLKVTASGNTTDYDLQSPTQITRTALRADKTSIATGASVDLTGSVTAALSGPLSTGAAQLQAAPYGSTDFTTVGTATLPATVFTVKPTAATDYRLQYLGSDPAAAPSVSPTVTIRIAASVTARLAAARVTSGKKFTLSGAVKPGAAGARVSLQRYVAKKWQTLATKKTDARGTYSFAKKATKGGTWKLRAAVASYDGNGAAVSPVRQLQVMIPVRITAAARPGTVAPQTQFTFRGRITPKRAKVTVTLQSRIGKRWVSINSTRTDAAGRYTFRITSGSAGVARLRVTTRATKTYRAATSPTRRVTVRASARPAPTLPVSTPHTQTAPTPPAHHSGGGTGIG